MPNERVMSFFDEPKNAGLAMIIAALVSLIAAIAGIVTGLIDDDGIQTANIIVAIGSLISAVVYFKYGSKVRSGAVSAKIDILAGFVNVSGVTTIIMGVFYIIAAIAGYDNGVGTGVLDIIIGLIIIWCGKKINDGKQTTIDKILWIILLVIFVLALLGSILSLFAFPIGTLTGICGIIIYLFMLILLFDSEVKKDMGM